MSEEKLMKIVLEQQKDGNWKGTITKYGKEITVREIGPETTLVRLLTHDGQ